ncbi:hypothetical protein VTK73DRAFT_6758 [Phialemonium thermophilum]|uniref:GH16 domain-containing protein n=1 Tax=Phialemonium thermophilum TaxID=223376 RepID=A0ABR3WHT6_9PEZI
MEFLSKDFNASNNSYPVNLVLQSRQAAEAGYDAQKTGNFARAELGFDPTASVHEYRFDLLPGRVAFYADGRKLADLAGDAVPSTAGHLVLQHWSNGNELWSGGPPRTDAVLAVSYVKAYFNSSLPSREEDWRRRCADAAAPRAVCAIPERTEANSSAGGFFFSQQPNMTNNQTVYGHSGAGGLRLWTSGWGAIAAAVLVGGWAGRLW